MNRLTLFFLSCLVVFCSHAQSQYMAQNRVEELDELGVPEGMAGVLVFSKSSDLVITVTNAGHDVNVERLGKGANGLFSYMVLVPLSDTDQPKLEISHRGKVDYVSFVAKCSRGNYSAYEIVEVDKPIDLRDQSSQNDVILDANLAEVEFSSDLDDLTVLVSPKLGADIKKSSKNDDRSILLTSVTFPVEVIKNAKNKVDMTQSRLESLEASQNSSWSQKEWDALDAAQEDFDNALSEYKSLTTIDVSGNGTNHLKVDISDMGPRSKRRYGVLILYKVEKEFVTEYGSLMDQADKFYRQRDYKSAKTAFESALAAPDCVENMKKVIRQNINDCDSCAKYNNLALGAITYLKKVRETSQEEAVEYAEAAIDDLRVLLKYNNIPFYEKQIENLEQFIKDQPLSYRFTTTKWVNDKSGLFENGPLGGVEIWARYGGSLDKNMFKNEKNFHKYVEKYPSEYVFLGTTDSEGKIDVDFDRKKLPQGIIFFPTNVNNKAKCEYKSYTDIFNGATGNFKKRQFRMKMFMKQ